MSSSEYEIGRVFVVSAPSGCGKTTLNRWLEREIRHKVKISTSLTTRPQRPSEEDGVDYYFVTDAAFRSAIDRGEMLEWANVHGNFYGTSLRELEKISAQGRSPILEIDVQGWQSIKKRLPDCVSVFILPPDMKTLWNRLSGRGTDSFDICWRRFQNARDEIAGAVGYHGFILNDDLQHAYEQLRSVIIDGQPAPIGAQEGANRCAALLAEFADQDLQDRIRDSQGTTGGVR